MRRRDFIKVIAGSATTWPLAAGAQQPGQPHNYAAQAIASVTADGAQRHYLVRFPRVGSTEAMPRPKPQRASRDHGVTKRKNDRRRSEAPISSGH
jgi:hypothetical protein